MSRIEEVNKSMDTITEQTKKLVGTFQSDAAVIAYQISCVTSMLAVIAQTLAIMCDKMDGEAIE